MKGLVVDLNGTLQFISLDKIISIRAYPNKGVCRVWYGAGAGATTDDCYFTELSPVTYEDYVKRVLG